MSTILGAVGKNGMNRHSDVVRVQRLLNDSNRQLTPLPLLNPDGQVGPRTLAAIERFQQRVVGMARPDSRVDPSGPTVNALLRHGCDQPQENFPYSEKTFHAIQRLAPLILSRSKRYDVPPIAVAGSIADEYNTLGPGDWVQDHVLFPIVPNVLLEMGAWVRQQRARFFPTPQELQGEPEKTPTTVERIVAKFNPTLHDLGIANIKVATAKRMYEQYQDTFARQDMNYADLVAYLESDTGTVHLAALVIKHARQVVAPYVQRYTEEKTEGIYVTYYKQGPNYLKRFASAAAEGNGHHLEPGEGCRVILQRDRFKEALGLP